MKILYTKFDNNVIFLSTHLKRDLLNTNNGEKSRVVFIAE
jgi:hypothetical protein